MNLNYIIIPLLTVNIFFTAYIAQKFLYIDNKDITINEEQYGECEEQKSITLDKYQEDKVKSKTARLWQLRAEIKSVMSPNINLSVLESYNYDRHRVYEEYVKPRVEELKKLDAELNPTKAPSKSIEGQRPPRPVRPPRATRPPR
jgi:hypothetical protein